MAFGIASSEEPSSSMNHKERVKVNVAFGSGTVLYFTVMSGGSITDTGPSCRNGSCALLSRHSVDLLQRRQSTLSSPRSGPGI